MNHRAQVKLVAEILQNRRQVNFEKLRRVLEAFGYECRQPKGGSSHYVFRKPSERFHITVPKAKPVTTAYVNQVIKELKLEEWYDENH